MTSQLNPYISFDGNAREAMEFYQDVLGGELTMHTFGEYGDPSAPEAEKIMHGMLQSDLGFTLMGADTPPGMPYNPGDNIAISLSGDDADTLRGYWTRLSDGGDVAVPWRCRCGAMSSASAPTASASPGWSTSAARPPDTPPRSCRHLLGFRGGRRPRPGGSAAGDEDVGVEPSHVRAPGASQESSV
ncbi:VOC family protein [Actinomadura madurae]|uniref:VOC family protein n=1 Tax=Actinomadura madurae TaxID=1993 RepID=UPI0020D2174C|nr:VOC family protein [Actinomadura madurae]MCQ0011094.1 VOC family protein [Actinomadura madurae]